MMPVKCLLASAVLFVGVLAAGNAAAENWVDFHSERWSFYSQKLQKKLYFKNRFFYDSDSVRSSGKDELRVWVKEISDNDRFYVGKGNPAKETSFRHLQLWCEKRRFMLIVGEAPVAQDESLSEEISPGTQFAVLYDRLCPK